MNQSLRTFFSIFTLVGFCASVLVHFLTFFGINVADYVPWIWVLHLGIFVAIIPLLGRDLRRDVFAVVPRWAKFAIGVFMVYAMVNFALFFFLSEGGTPAIWDGKYVLHSHGRLIRELSEHEYHLQEAYVLRGFSGHWMIFYFLPVMYSLYRK